MFIVEPSHKTIAAIRQAMMENLADIVMILPHVEDEIIDRLRWAIFSESRYNMMDRPRLKRYDHCADIAGHIFDDAALFLDAHGELSRPFITAEVRHACIGREMHVYVDAEDCDVQVIVEPVSLAAEINTKDAFYLACSLPDSAIVFESLIQGDLYHDANIWLYPYMEMYDDWVYTIMFKYQKMLWQMGGYGRYIQKDYEDRYIGQINLDIGDAGSVYLYVDSKGEINGSIDMH